MLRRRQLEKAVSLKARFAAFTIRHCLNTLPRIQSQTSGHLKRNWFGYATGDMRWIMRKTKTLRGYTDRIKYAFSISAPVGRMGNERIRELAGYILEIKRQIEEKICPQ